MRTVAHGEVVKFNGSRLPGEKQGIPAAGGFFVGMEGVIGDRGMTRERRELRGWAGKVEEDEPLFRVFSICDAFFLALQVFLLQRSPVTFFVDHQQP